MKQALKLSAVLSCLAMMALPATAQTKTNLIDHSADSLIDAEAAKAVLSENIPAKVWKIYPASKYTFLSQVEGGITTSGQCVVTARVMLLPLTPTVRAVLFRPQKTATAFDALAGSSAAQCKTLARDKLKEATNAVVSALVKS
ncbi:MAG: hypothetical protein H7Z19_19270 [Chitinophagaceae bacterium]|nr:hypothetical protein [Rubrivivax sp.]